MKYLVMECHPGYAVVLDDEGNFKKVANLNYEVGQMLSEVVEFLPAKKEAFYQKRWVKAAMSAAACFLAVIGIWQVVAAPYGSVRLQINPDVSMTVNRVDQVIDIVPMNADGKDLIADYEQDHQYKWKKVDLIADELADHAKEMGYLKEGGEVHLTVESDHEQWKTEVEERIVLELEVHLGKEYIIVPILVEEDDIEEVFEEIDDEIEDLLEGDADDDDDDDDDDRDEDDDDEDRDDDDDDVDHDDDSDDEDRDDEEDDDDDDHDDEDRDDDDDDEDEEDEERDDDGVDKEKTDRPTVTRRPAADKKDEPDEDEPDEDEPDEDEPDEDEPDEDEPDEDEPDEDEPDEDEPDEDEPDEDEPDEDEPDEDESDEDESDEDED